MIGVFFPKILSQEKKLYLGKVFVNELIGLTCCQLYAQLLVTANEVVNWQNKGATFRTRQEI